MSQKRWDLIIHIYPSLQDESEKTQSCLKEILNDFKQTKQPKTDTKLPLIDSTLTQNNRITTKTTKSKHRAKGSEKKMTPEV